MPQDPLPDPLGADAGSDRHAGSLSSEVKTLTSVIRDLEDQLDRMMAANDAVKQDLDEERKRRAGAQARVDEVEERLQRAEQELNELEKLRAELGHLHHERARLADQVRELTQRAEDGERERERQSRLAERLRAARAHALEEVTSVEAQFERAMQLVTHVKAQLTIAAEERDTLAARLKGHEDTLRLMQQERDALITEVEESRAALDEIRRSLVDSFGAVPGAGRAAHVSESSDARVSR
jgi:chromosome segregation protein